MNLQRFSYAQGEQIKYIEDLWQQYKQDPNSVDASWQKFFEGYEFASTSQLPSSGASGGESTESRNHARVEAFINAYRSIGHVYANVNPLKPSKATEKPDFPLRPEALDLASVKPTDMFETTNYGSGSISFKEIQEKLLRTYCDSVGADFREITNIEEVVWLQNQMEPRENKANLSPEDKKFIVKRLAEGEGFERFLQARYLGQKRFSGEGLDALMPLMDWLVEHGSRSGVNEICLGMAHRGRLNILCNVLGKPLEKIFIEFEGYDPRTLDHIEGDVKYHMGFAGEIESRSGNKVLMFLSSNPSHLEIVNPVLEGFARRRQEEVGSIAKVLPILMHGDAAFIGQGTVAETLNLSQLEGYKTGGTVHIITNNQVGFTTNPEEGKSCGYSSDLAKIIRAPVFHVNADDPEAVVWVAELALNYRQRYAKDVVIDLMGYRRHGHNETDEPSFTQPLMYKIITQHPTVFSIYSQKLRSQNILSEEELTTIQAQVKDRLEKAHEHVKTKKDIPQAKPFPAVYAPVFKSESPNEEQIFKPAKTAVSLKTLTTVAELITSAQEGFHIHPKLARIMEQRKNMLAQSNEAKIDWGMGELLAYGTLAHEGYEVRLTGQDVRRGTFSHRHAVIFDYETGAPFELLKKVGKVSIINSPLSEVACMGFEFGYSLATHNNLVLWEAQFGDFANGAQIVIDQFLVAAEAKWQQSSCMTLLLPHGYEGMGPEHSSARPERFLQLCGDLNIQVCQLTTPAQLFHLLRRQLLRPFQKPLIIMSPKSLLRHPLVVSTPAEFTNGKFEEFKNLNSKEAMAKIKRLVLCSGKLYFEMNEEKNKRKLDSVGFVTCEQFYPFHKDMLKKILADFPQLKELVWAQEEPENMGAWTFLAPRLQELLPKNVKLSGVTRPAAGTTAEGSLKAHQQIQQQLILRALDAK